MAQSPPPSLLNPSLPPTTTTTTTIPNPSTTQPLPSPTTAPDRKHSLTHASHETIPLTSPQRTTPVHPSLPSLLLPAHFATANLNPLTLQEFTTSELSQHSFTTLQAQCSTKSKDDVAKMIEDEVKKLVGVVEERERREKEVERELREKEREREVERKIYRMKMGG